MARLTLSDLVEEAQLLYEDISLNKVKFAANFILRDLDSERLAPVRGRVSFTTKGPVKGTANVTNGSNVIFTTMALQEHVYQKIQVDGTLTWYIIESAVDGVSFQVTSGYDGPDGTAKDCRVVFDRYSLSSKLVGLKTIRREDKEPLKKVVDESDAFGISELRTAEPIRFYETERLLNPEVLEIVLVNPPDNVYTYLVNGTHRLTRFDEDSSMTDIPEEYEHCLLCGMFWILTTFEEGVEISSFWKSWYFNLKKAITKTRGPTQGPSFSPLIQGPAMDLPIQERFSEYVQNY